MSSKPEKVGSNFEFLQIPAIESLQGAIRHNRGTEGDKYTSINVSGFDLGFDTGFLLLSDKGSVVARYRKWSKMKNEGLSDYLTRWHIPIRMGDQFGILSEDLTSLGYVIYEEDDLDEGLMPPLIAEASRWLNSFFESEINNKRKGGLEENINSVEDRNLREGLGYLYETQSRDREIDKLRALDPFLEIDTQRLTKLLENSSWGVKAEAFFILTRKTNNRSWPYERRLLLGDLGSAVEKTDKPGFLNEKYKDKLYSMLTFVCSV